MRPKSRFRLTRLELSFLVMTALAGALFGGVSRASNWNEVDQIYKAGTNSTVQFHECNLSPNTHDAFHANNDHDIAPTDIFTTLAHSCNEAEVRINDAEFGLSQPKGFYHCHAMSGPQNCSNAHAHINRSYPDIPENYGPTEHVVCEEIGHSVGLGHHSQNSNLDSCLVLLSGKRHLAGHDKNHLNDNY
jgi:hypothetical protein